MLRCQPGDADDRAILGLAPPLDVDVLAIRHLVAPQSSKIKKREESSYSISSRVFIFCRRIFISRGKEHNSPARGRSSVRTTPTHSKTRPGIHPKQNKQNKQNKLSGKHTVEVLDEIHHFGVYFGLNLVCVCPFHTWVCQSTLSRLFTVGLLASRILPIPFLSAERSCIISTAGVTLRTTPRVLEPQAVSQEAYPWESAGRTHT